MIIVRSKRARAAQGVCRAISPTVACDEATDQRKTGGGPSRHQGCAPAWRGPSDVGTPPRTDGSIGCAWSSSAWRVRRTSRPGMPAMHAGRIRAWLDIEEVGDGEWLPSQVGETSLKDR